MRTSILASLALSVLVLSACGRASSPNDNTSVDIPSVITQGDAPSVAYGSVEAATDVSINGIVVVHHTSDTTGTITFQVNIEPAATGSRYEGWITNSKTGEELRIGQLENPANDVRHAIRYEAAQSLVGYDSARITLQSDGASDQGTTVATAKMQTSGQ